MHPLVAQIGLPIVGLIGPGLVLLGLPGTWVLLALAAICEWLTEPTLFSDGVRWSVFVLALLGEGVEFLASAMGAKRAGAGRRGAIGALIGGIAGAIGGTFLIPIPLLGTLIGGGLGAFAGATTLERHGGRDLSEAMRVGRAAGIGHMLGLFGKFAIGAAAWLVLTVAIVTP